MSELRGLLVTHEGFGTSIIRTQVIEHCSSLRAAQIEIDILTYETFPKAWRISVDNLKSYRAENTELAILLKKAAYIYMPFSTLFNAILLLRDIRKLCRSANYQFIHARADYSAFLCLVLKPFHRLPVIWDCRGDSVDELAFSLSAKGMILRSMLGRVLIFRQKRILGFCKKFSDGAVFVSDLLRGSLDWKLDQRPGKVIPCPVPESLFFFDSGVRQEARIRLGIPEDAVMFLYSGSTTGYQGLTGQVDLYKRILENPRNYIVIATTETREAERIFNAIMCDRLVIKRFAYREMNSIYNAADFAFMLREARKLNAVASPTKFGEYCLTGLAVIHNDAVEQVSKIAGALGLGRHVSELDALEPISGERRLAASHKAVDTFSRRLANCEYSYLYDAVVRAHSQAARSDGQPL